MFNTEVMAMEVPLGSVSELRFAGNVAFADLFALAIDQVVVYDATGWLFVFDGAAHD